MQITKINKVTLHLSVIPLPKKQQQSACNKTLKIGSETGTVTLTPEPTRPDPTRPGQKIDPVTCDRFHLSRGVDPGGPGGPAPPIFC